MPDRHKHPPIRFRPPEADRLWLAAYQQETGKPMNAILTEAVQRLRAETQLREEKPKGRQE